MLTDHFEAFGAYLREGDERQLAGCFGSGADLGAARVYRNGFIKTTTNALAANFPSIVTLVGEEFFRFLSAADVQRHPPIQSSLVGYGEHFPVFLDEVIDRHGLVYLADFAKLDRAWLTSYFSLDQQSLNSDHIHEWVHAGADIDDLPVIRCQHAQLVETDHTIPMDTWFRLRQAKPPVDHISLLPERQTVLIWREHRAINARILTGPESAFLAALDAPETLRSASELALEIDATFDLAEFFALLLIHGILRRAREFP